MNDPGCGFAADPIQKLPNTMKKLLSLIAFSLACASVSAGDAVSLQGRWRIVADPSGKGLSLGWYKGVLPTHAEAYPAGAGMLTNDYIDLPGSPDRAGIGSPLKPISSVTPEQEKRVVFKGPYWLQKRLDFSTCCGGPAVFATDPLPEGSKLYWDGREAVPVEGGFAIDIESGQHLATFYIEGESAGKVLPAGGFRVICGGRTFPVEGRWRIVPEMHNRALAGQWSRGELPAPKSLYLYYATYFRGAAYSMADSVDLPATPASAGIATMLNPSRAITQGLERAIRYDGPFWVQRTVTVPAEWKGSDAVFSIERAPGMSKCYWDGIEVGECHGYDIRQRFTIPAAVLTPGEHLLTVYNSRSDNAWPQTGHGVKSENGVNWCGLLGRIELRCDNGLENIQVYPDIDRNAIAVGLRVSAADQVRFSYREKGKGGFVSLGTFEVRPGKYEMSLPRKAKLWSEFSPALYELRCEGLSAGRVTGVSDVVFGMRRFEAVPEGFLLNGKRIFLRGAQQCGADPLENVTPMDRGYWDRIVRLTKEWGMNHLRFHSWCPPRAAFEAADEAGVILQIELPHDDIAGTKKTPYKELIRILDEYGNHPSFCMITLGNERFNHNEASRKAIDGGRRHDPRHLYACTSHPFDNHCSDDFYISAWGINNLQPNGWGNPITGIEWGGGDVVSKSRFNTAAPETRYDYRAEIAGNRAPIITHEVGQWAMFPDLGALDKYTGVLVNTNYQRIREKMERRGMLSLARKFADASGKFSAALYKEEIESAFRTPGLAGYSLLGINDFPGQHLSVIGMLDEFWDDKGIVTPEFHSMYSRAVVPLARMERRVWLGGEIFSADIEIANYGPDALGGEVRWIVADERGRTLRKGAFPKRTIMQGGLTQVGRVEMPLSEGQARKLVLTVYVPGREIRNSWNFWVYPADPVVKPGDVRIADRWNDSVKQALAKGEKVLLVPAKESLKKGYRESCFTPVFWNSIFKWMQKSHTLGVLCDPSHPVFASFPTDSHADWQWWDVMMYANAMYLNDLPREIEPLVQVIDSYVFCDKLAFLWECRVGAGKLVVCTIDLLGDLSGRPASRQLESSLLNYMNSPAFAPVATMNPAQVDEIFEN